MSHFVIVLCLPAAILGCGKTEEIQTYTVPKFQDRMLASMTIHDGTAWFFKMIGPATMVSEQADAFRAVVQSITFSPAGKPLWDLPAGWIEEPGSDQTRHATLRTGETPGAVQATVIPLEAPTGDIAQYELANVNRWLGQLSLTPITADQIDETVERLTLKDGQAIWLDAIGTPGAGGMRAPFMAGNRPHPPINENTAPAADNAAESPVGETSVGGGPTNNGSPLLTYTKPKSWEPGRMSPMRKAAFVAKDGESSVEITVIDLAATAGDLLSNVNRWRGQVQLDPIDLETLNQQLMEVPVDDVSGQFVEMFGPDSAQAILGVVAIRQDRAWFFKLTGNSTLAAIEKERFLDFVKSTKFAD